MEYDLPDTNGIILPWSPPPGVSPKVLTEVSQRLRALYNDLLDSFTSKPQSCSETLSALWEFDDEEGIWDTPGL